MAFEKFHNGTTPDVHTTAAAANAVLQPLNKNRAYGIMSADPANTVPIFLNFGDAAQVGKGIPIFPGGNYEITADNYTHTAVNVICASAGQTLYTAFG